MQIKTAVKFSAFMLLSVIVAAAPASGGPKKAKPDPEPARILRLAVFDLDVLKSTELEAGGALTDQVVTLLSTTPGVTIVNRDQLEKVAEEHKIALSGLVDSKSAVSLGNFVSAQYVVVGRASRIGQNYYVTLKFIDVETTVQTIVAAKSAVGDGAEAIIAQLEEPLSATIRKLQAPVADPDDERLAEMRKITRPLAGKTFLVDVSEQHIDRPLNDPAAQMAAAARLRSLGIQAIVPKDPVAGWKEELLRSGKYGERTIDYLIEGEGTSAYAAQIQGLVSCRARVELRAVAVPGREVTVSDKGVGARADLVEALAAKSALEDAAIEAIDSVMRQLCGNSKE